MYIRFRQKDLQIIEYSIEVQVSSCVIMNVCMGTYGMLWNILQHAFPILEKYLNTSLTTAFVDKATNKE
jgi:hypothetical protein